MTSPLPPSRAQPPMTAAAMGSKLKLSPSRTVVDCRRATLNTPPTAASRPVSTKAPMRTRSVLMPDSWAALKLDPTAYRLVPKRVFFSKN